MDEYLPDQSGRDKNWKSTAEIKIAYEDQQDFARACGEKPTYVSRAGSGDLPSFVKRAVDNECWRSHKLITAEAYGNDGKRREVLLSNLPVEIQNKYFQTQKTFTHETDTLWLYVLEIAKLTGIARVNIQKVIKRGTWRGHILTNHEAIGRGGRRMEVLLSSLPTEVQNSYWQSKGGGENEIKLQEKEVRQELPKPVIKQVGRVFRVCGQAFGLDKEE